MKKSFNPKDCIGALNNVKQAMLLKGNQFTTKEIKDILSNCGIPSNNTFFTIFRNSGIITPVGRGLYKWSNNDPIYVGKLESIKHKYSSIVKKYNSKAVEVKEIVPNSVDNQIQEAINLLKKNGYEIYAPVVMTVYQKI